MCPNEDYAWDHIPKTAYAEHSQDTCPECGASRFLQDTMKPAKVRQPHGTGRCCERCICRARRAQQILLESTNLHETWLHTCRLAPAWANRCMYMHAQVYYDFGLANVICKLFGDPEWAAARGKGRDTSAGGFYGGPEAARLDRVTRGLFGKDSSSAYELGMDFGQIFNFKTHSTGIVLLRSASSCSS